MKEPTISIAMATYNGERFLQEQLDSLARQTLLPCELVVCDDGSTDGTLAILEKFAAEAPFPVRIFRNEVRLGYGPNFLKAASLCSGDLIAFCDQDDVWLEEKLARCSALMFSTDTNLVIHAGRVVDEHLNPLGTFTASAPSPTQLDSCVRGGWRPLGYRLGWCPGFTCVFRSRLLTQMPPAPPVAGPGIGHEGWLFFAAEAMGRVFLIPDALALYRQHGSNAVGFLGSPSRGRLVLEPRREEYLRQARLAEGCTRLLAEAAERMPELRPRLERARRWQEERSKYFARRASLYGSDTSFAFVVQRLSSLVFSGTYRPPSRGGLGLECLAKDLVVPALPRALRDWLGRGSRAPIAAGMEKSE